MLVRERASKALSIPVALREGLILESLGPESESSWERSRPLVFFTAVLEFLGVARASFSSAARRASFSAFLRAASCFLASASSLLHSSGDSYSRVARTTDFLAFDFAPLLHS